MEVGYWVLEVGDLIGGFWNPDTGGPTVVTLRSSTARLAGGGKGFVLSLALAAVGVVGLLPRARRRR